MMSLFEYLNRPAGPELGRRVFNFAQEHHCKVKTKEISTRKFTGKVMIYEKETLDKYFNEYKLD